MKVLRAPTEWVIELGELIRPKTPQQRQERIVSALVVLAGLIVLYNYFV